LGRNIVTAKSRVLFSNFHNFPPISFENIKSETNIDYKIYATRSSTGLGQRILDSLWNKLIITLQKLEPKSYEAYNKLKNIIRNLSFSFADSGLDIIAQEKDTIGLAIDIFGLDREDILFSWAPVTSKPVAPYIEGLTMPRILEDAMIIRDTSIFSNWKGTPPDAIGSVQFSKEGKLLTVTNFNRHKVEENTGVDLIYYNHDFNSYVMVQYKKMQVEPERQGNRTRNIIVYRPSGKSYNNEIKQMKDLENRLQPEQTTVLPLQEYRMHTDPFYFKLCLPFHLELAAAELIKGMYFPLDYWQEFLNSPDARGKRDGLRIVYQDSERHINNTLFIDLVKHGWIGSRLHQSSILGELIRNSIEQKRSVTFAASANLS
jgi:hypothetical protein